MSARRLSVALVAVAALAAPAAAEPLGVSITFVPPTGSYTGDEQPLDAPFTLIISYNFEPHVWTGVSLTLSLPNKTTHPRIAIGTDSETGDTFAPGVLTAGASDSLKWIGTPAANSGISGQIFVTLTAEAWGSGGYGPSIDDTPYTFSATLTGTPGGGAPTTAVANGTRVGVGAANPLWQYPGSLYGTGPSYAVESAIHETTLESGLLLRYNFRIYNCANNPVDLGSTIDVSVGSALQVARHWSGDNGANYPASYLPLDGPLVPPGVSGEIWSTTPGNPSQVGVTHPYRLDSTPGCGYTNNYYVDIWASCATMAARVAAGQAAQSLAPWQLSAVAHLNEPHFGQASTATSNPLPTTPVTIPAITCGNVDALQKNADHSPPSSPNNVSLNGTRTWTVAFSVPFGITRVDEFALVDVLPMRGTETTFTQWSYFTNRGLSPYFCTLTPGSYPSYAQIQTHIGASCLPAVLVSGRWQAAATQTAATVSHFVLVGNYVAPTDGNIYRVSLTGSTFVPSTFDSSTAPDFGIIRNRAYINGLADLDFNNTTTFTAFGNTVPETGSEDIYEDAGSARVVDYACPSTQLYNFGVTQLAPGDCSFAQFYVRSNDPYRPARNLTFQVDLADGMVVTDTQLGDMCVENPDQGLTEPAPPYSDPMLFELGTGGQDCSLRVGGQTVRIDFCADPNVAFENGQTLSMVIDLLAHDFEGQPGDCPASLTRTAVANYAMLVPGEMSATVAPICRGDGAIGFRMRALNTGGMDLSRVIPTLELPRMATGSDADAVYLGVDAIDTNGQPYVVEASATGTSWGSATPGDAAIRFIQLRGTAANGLGIEAVTGSPIDFEVLVSGPTVGAELFASGTLAADTGVGAMPTANAAASQPYVVGGCRALTVTKFFDGDGDGVEDTGDVDEPRLPGWTFEVVNADGAIVGSGTTNALGVATFLLTVGDYTVTELAQSTPPATWSVTAPADAVGDRRANVTIALGGAEPSLKFGNSCACPDADTDLCTGRCLPTGLCDNTFVTGCDDGSQCTSDACDPETGLCASVARPCLDVDYYIAVADGAGEPAGIVHCVLTPGAAPRCDMEAGQLKVWPLGTPTIQSCGASAIVP